MTNGQVWRVIRVPAGDPRLIDRTMTARLATTSPRDRAVYMDESLEPPMLDRVLLHEVAHAVTMSYGLLPELRHEVLRGDIIGVEEWAAQLVENHALEALRAASVSLGRPVCIKGDCL